MKRVIMKKPRIPHKKIQAKAKAYDFQGFNLTMALVALAFVLAQLAFASVPEDFHKLEKQVWTAEESQFSTLENQIAKRIQINPHSAADHYLLAHLYVKRYGENPSRIRYLKKASDLGQQALDLAPKKEWGYVIIAEVLDLMGQTENALKILDPTFNPDLTPGWRTYFLQAKLRSDQFGEANLLALLETALKQPGSQADVIAPYVVAIIRLNQDPIATLTSLKRWNNNYPNQHFREAMALTHTKLGNVQKAHQLYVENYGPSFDHPEAMFNDAVLLYKNMQEYQKAETLLTHLTQRLAEKSPKTLIAMAYAHLGAIQVRKMRYQAAEESFQKALMNAQNRYPILEFVATEYRDAKKFKELAALVEKMTLEIPGSGVLHALLGETLSEDLGDHDRALEAFSDAIVLEPGRSDFYTGMGLTYYKQKHLDKALFVFNQAAKVDPEDAIARYNVACVLARLNRADEALLALREAISLDPRLAQNAIQDEDFNSIKKDPTFQDVVKSHSQVSH